MAAETFLQKLQSADERTKRVWMIASSCLIMTGVVYVWLAYFNSITAVPATATENDAQSAQVYQGFSLGESLRGALASVYDAFLGRVHILQNFFGASRTYTISPN